MQVFIRFIWLMLAAMVHFGSETLVVVVVVVVVGDGDGDGVLL